jgi:hypothetical protein
VFGALLGALVPAATTVLAWWLGFEDVAGLALVGIAPGGIAGWVLARSAVASRSALLPFAAAVALGVGLGVGEVVGGSVLGGTPPQVFLLLPYVLVYGIALGTPIAGPTAVVAIVLLRIAVRRRRLGAVAVVALLALTVLLGVPALALGTQVSARRALPNLGVAPPIVALFPVQLDWQIANCSPWPYTVRVFETHLDGTRSAQSMVAAPARAERGSLVLEPGWEATLEADAAAAVPPAWLGPHPAIRDALGNGMVARFEIAVDGEWSVRTWRDRRMTGAALCGLVAPAS